MAKHITALFLKKKKKNYMDKENHPVYFNISIIA